MKHCLLFIALVAVVSCGITHIDSKFYKYDKDLSFKVKQSANAFMTESGEGNKTYANYAKKGTAFKRLTFVIRNTAGEDRLVNFEKFKLIDKAGNEYYVKEAIQHNTISTKSGELLLKIKAGKTRGFFVEFWPPFPKSEKITKIMFKNKKIKLEKAE